MSNLKVEIRQGEAALHELRAEWQALYRVADATPFLAWEWAVTWQQWLNRRGMPLLLCAREAGRLVGLLALNEETVQIVGWPVRRLSLLGDGYGGADYLDVLALPGREAEVTAALFTFLTQQVSFDALELEGMAANSPSVTWLAGVSQSRFQYDSNPLYICPQINLTAGWDSVLKNCHRAENFRRRWRQLQKRQGFAFRLVTEPADAPAAFARFLQLHEARWAAEGGSEMTGHARLQSFHRDLVVRWAQAGLLHFGELWVEGACRASLYGLQHGGCYYLYNIGYDQAWRNASVGLVVLGLSIQAAIERGATVCDFLRGTERYKFDWADTTRATVLVRLAPLHLRSRVFFYGQQTAMALRQGVRDVVPSSLRFPLQQLRRAWVRKREFGGVAVPLSLE